MIKEATIGAGCFWCIEACYKDLKGVISVFPAYSGGKMDTTSYKEVCTGETGHAEVARVTFNDEILSFEELLEVFWFVHDPTQLNRQGGDVGTQYRSVIFFHDLYQKKIAEEYKEKLTIAEVWGNPVVTEISPLINCILAEDYHNDYFNLNPGNPYCASVVRPKVEKFRKVFAEKLKTKKRGI